MFFVYRTGWFLLADDGIKQVSKIQENVISKYFIDVSFSASIILLWAINLLEKAGFLTSQKIFFPIRYSFKF